MNQLIEDIRASEFPLDDLHLLLEKAVEAIIQPRIRHAGRNAFRHLRKAWRLHKIDPEMSLFRAITAEEEAATALIRAFHAQRYPNSHLFKERNHSHKASIWPFIGAVGKMLEDRSFPMPQIRIGKKKPHKIELLFDTRVPHTDGTTFGAIPDQPFNFVLNSDVEGPFKLHDFRIELAAIADMAAAQSINAHIREAANLRNRLIYASEQGAPSVKLKVGALLERRKRVTVLLILTVATLQTPVHQLFLVQCVDNLLLALGETNLSQYIYPDIDSSKAVLRVIQQPDGTIKANFQSSKIISISFGYTLKPVS